MKHQEDQSDLLTIHEAAKFLNLKISRLYYMRFYNRIPYYKIGASIRFSKTELTKWLTLQKSA